MYIPLIELVCNQAILNDDNEIGLELPLHKPRINQILVK